MLLISNNYGSYTFMRVRNDHSSFNNSSYKKRIRIAGGDCLEAQNIEFVNKAIVLFKSFLTAGHFWSGRCWKLICWSWNHLLVFFLLFKHLIILSLAFWDSLRANIMKKGTEAVLSAFCGSFDLEVF